MGVCVYFKLNDTMTLVSVVNSDDDCIRNASTVSQTGLKGSTGSLVVL